MMSREVHEHFVVGLGIGVELVLSYHLPALPASFHSPVPYLKIFRATDLYPSPNPENYLGVCSGPRGGLTWIETQIVSYLWQSRAVV